jgi:hypothetical protein
LKKKTNVMLMFVLACSMTAFAQSGMSSDSTMQNGSGKAMSMTGCVAEKDGKYMLQTKKHRDGVMLMSSEDMKPHVGHTVTVMGSMQHMDAGSGGAMASGGAMSSGSSDTGMSKGMMQMNVTSMKMVSDTCSMPMGK